MASVIGAFIAIGACVAMYVWRIRRHKTKDASYDCLTIVIRDTSRRHHTNNMKDPLEQHEQRLGDSNAFQSLGLKVGTFFRISESRSSIESDIASSHRASLLDDIAPSPYSIFEQSRVSHSGKSLNDDFKDMPMASAGMGNNDPPRTNDSYLSMPNTTTQSTGPATSACDWSRHATNDSYLSNQSFAPSSHTNGSFLPHRDSSLAWTDNPSYLSNQDNLHTSDRSNDTFRSVIDD
jgi:hypothetical protein